MQVIYLQYNVDFLDAKSLNNANDNTQRSEMSQNDISNAFSAFGDFTSYMHDIMEKQLHKIKRTLEFTEFCNEAAETPDLNEMIAKRNVLAETFRNSKRN